MGSIRDAGRKAFRDYEVDGVPASRPNEVKKVEAREVFELIDAALASLGVNGAITVKYAARATLFGDLAHAANTLAIVYNDSTAAYNGIYAKVGASGSGSWTLTNIALPSSFVTDLAQTRAIADGVVLVLGAGANTTFIGGAGNVSQSGANVTAIGSLAARDLTTGANSVYVGRAAGKINTTGAENVVVGYSASELSATLSQVVSVGSRAGGSTNSGAVSNSVFFGFQAGRDYSGEGLTAIGHNCLPTATGQRNTAVGTAAGQTVTTGARNSLLGYNAQCGAALNDTIVLGYSALATASGQIVLGTSDQTHLMMFGQGFARRRILGAGDNYWLLGTGPAAAPTGASNLGIGKDALGAITYGYLNTALGEGALRNATGAVNITALGYKAGENIAGAVSPNHASDSVYVGALAGQNITKGVGAVAVGYRAMGKSTLAQGGTAIGDSALWVNDGYGAVAVGYTAGEFVTDGENAVLIGTNAGGKRGNAQRCVYIGKSAGEITSNTANCNIVTGTGGAAAGVDNVGIGYLALRECLGSRVVAIGTGAGQSLVGTANQTLASTFVGFYAGLHANQKTDAANSMALGNQTYTTANNQIAFGNASTIDVLIGMGGANTRLALRTATPTSTAHIDGSMALALRTVTATTTASATDHTILCDAAGAMTVNLPAAAGCPGRIYVVKKISAANNVTIDGNGTETIDGATTKVLTTQYETARLQSDGNAWFSL